MTFKLLQLLSVVVNFFIYIVLSSCSKNSHSSIRTNVNIQYDDAESRESSISRKKSLKSCAKRFTSINNPDNYHSNSEVKFIHYRSGSVIARNNRVSEATIVAKVSDRPSTGSIFSKYDENNKKVLTYYGLMVAGAIARSASATAVHPLNVIKVMLQTRHGKMPEFKWSVLSRGAGSQFIMSVPHGAISFVVTETTKKEMLRLLTNSTIANAFPARFLNPALDFLSSSVSTFICSVVSTPQMVLTDQIMAGVYSNFFAAVYSIATHEGLIGFYKGWLPALAQKIPSYALTWMFFQHFKKMFLIAMDRPGTTFENTMLGSIAAAGACCVMIPIDTVKTRIVTQRPGDGGMHYHGMFDCIQKILKHEGVASFYRALPPRLLSVVPMIGIQFGVYELLKRLLIGLPAPKSVAGQEYYHHHHDYEGAEVIVSHSKKSNKK